MLHESQIEFIHQGVGENIERCRLLKETSCSWLWLVGGERDYVLKISKDNIIGEEYENHKVIYDIWSRNKHNLDFKIPRPYAIRSDRQSYIMDYIEQGRNLLEILLRKDPQVNALFRRAGRCLFQYHELTTRELINEKQNFFSHNTVEQILKGPEGKKVRQVFCESLAGTRRIIFKDFKPTNTVLSKDNEIYFLDFQKIYYFAPFYYDLARFIDTTKVFAIVEKPFFSLSNSKIINSAVKNFLSGYGIDFDRRDLRKMQWFHRTEHVRMKANVSFFNSLMLRFIYRLI